MLILRRRLGMRRNLIAGELLSFRDMFKRWAVLSLLGVLAASVALTVMLAKVQIAGLFVPTTGHKLLVTQRILQLKQNLSVSLNRTFLLTQVAVQRTGLR